LGGAPEVTSALPTILQRFATQRALTESVLALAALGPIALAGGAVAMLAGLLARRRIAAVALARGRGASAALVLGAQVWEAIVVAGGGALVGLVLAVEVVPARGSPLSAALAVATVGVAVLLLAAASWPAIRRPLGAIERDGRPARRSGPRRIVIEATVVAIAVIAALLLAQRGAVISPTGTGSGQLASFDPLLAAVPVLAGLAAGILVTRLYPLPIRAFARLAARRRDVVPVLGLWTIGRDPAATSLPLLVLLMTAAFGAFSSVIASSLDQGQVTAAALTVGADYRVESAGIAVVPTASTLAAIPGVEAVAPAYVDPRAPFRSEPTQLASTYLDAIDPRAYATVAAGSAADPRWPAVFLDEPPASGAGSAAAPIPAILSSRLPNGTSNLGPGATFDLDVNGLELTFRLVEQRADFAGLGGPTTFAIVPLPWVDAALGSQAPRPSVLWVRGPASIAGSLRDAVAASGSVIRVVARAEVLAALRDAPLTSVVGAGYGLALVVAAGYMALAFVGAIVLSAARRSRDLAYLRTLGVSPVQSLGLTVVEHGPTVVLALAAGLALGLGLALALEPSLGLDGFVGMSGVPPSIDWPTLAVMVIALAAVVVGALLGGTWLSRRAPVTDVLRIGEA
ncbi:MAG TPA: FtsX-like permease family protein, partial [Candidatus Limnocylindrales bacterium]|nr:FtsX-like permease family protein [Candidatus Limnocylindrales bacterium]